MISQQILDKIESLQISDKVNLKRTIQMKKEVPKYIREALHKNEILILGDGDLLDYYNQPMIVIPLNDAFAMFQSAHIPKRRRRIQKIKEE